MPEGGEYPSQYTQYHMFRQYIPSTETYSYTASLPKLTLGRDYTYWLCLTNQPDTASMPRTFRLAESSGPLSFFLLGDPQIIEADRGANLKTLDEVLAVGLSIQPEPSFLISLGDQVNSEDSVLEYDAFVRAAAFKRIPLAAICGNHDVNGPFAAYLGTPGMTENNNYFFVRGNALFIALDSNDPDVDGQKQFIRDAIAAEPARWVFVLMHHGLYSAGPHSDSSDIGKLRAAYADFFTEMDIDAVLSGHDHIYARSHLMKDGSPVSSEDEDVGAALTKRPGETVYLTATSSTGSKHYALETDDAMYLACVDERSEACLTIVNLEHESVTFTTYCADDLSIVDRFVLTKD
jgi:predicted phosphodiesterase